MASQVGQKRASEDITSLGTNPSLENNHTDARPPSKAAKKAEVILTQDLNTSHQPLSQVDILQNAIGLAANKKYTQALDMLESALSVHKIVRPDTKKLKELERTIIDIKNQRLLHRLEQAPNFISLNKLDNFKYLIETLRGDNLLSVEGISNLMRENLSVKHEYPYLVALIYEFEKNFTAAVPHYLHLATEHETPIPSLLKAFELIQYSKDPSAVADFLENLDSDWIERLEKNNDEFNKIVDKKDAIRMAFEEALEELGSLASRPRDPTCFICFNVEEKDIQKWLRHTYAPDLSRVGVKPIYCLKELDQGQHLDTFQELIRTTDLAIIICTPDVQKKCQDPKTQRGCAKEIAMALKRDQGKDKTIFPIYVKGDLQTSCPRPSIEPIFGSVLTTGETLKDEMKENLEAALLCLPLTNYYSNSFLTFGSLKGVSRDKSSAIKESFLKKIPEILQGKIDISKLTEWRNQKRTHIIKVNWDIIERISQNIQMVNLPLAPLNFTGRTQELLDLHTACQQYRRVAVTGLGGLGKSSLAIKYANDYRLHYQFIHFMPAGSSQQVIDGLLRLADDLHVLKTDKIKDRLCGLKRILDRFEQNYLLILDGLDQKEAFDEIVEYLPSRKGSVVLTTRMPEQSKIEGFVLIQLAPLSLKEAVDYLLNVTGSKEHKAAEEVCEKLGRLPLALTHASRYINNPKISIKKYIENLNQYQMELFNDANLTLGKDEKTILTTWEMSMDIIEKVYKCTLSKKILEFLAFLGQAPIPQFLIETWLKKTYPEQSALQLRNALKALLDYSMIETLYPEVYSIHLLVQNVVRFKMNLSEKATVFEQVLDALLFELESYGEINFTSWNRISSCIPPGITLFEMQDLLSSIKKEKQFRFTYALGCICKINGNIEKNLNLSIAGVKIAKELSGENPNYENTYYLSNGLNTLGIALIDSGKAEEALGNYRQALEIFQKVDGVSHPVAISLNCIGDVLLNLGKAEEALENHRQALEIHRQVYGMSHPYVAGSLNYMGSALLNLGKAEEALENHRQALEIFRQASGESHPVVAGSLIWIGKALLAFGRTEEALGNHRQALEIYRQAYGESHPVVAGSLNCTGDALLNLGKAEEALGNHRQALEIYRQVYGMSHPYIAGTLNYIGDALLALGKAEEALENHRQALEIFRQVYGVSHSDVAASLNYMGSALLKLGKAEEALGSYRQALEIRRQVYGVSHSDVAASLNYMGSALLKLGKTEEALENHRQALEILRKVYGMSHPDAADSLNFIGDALLALGKKEEALGNYQQALEIHRQVYDESHPVVAANSEWIRRTSFKTKSSVCSLF
jgi:tetratricopeptide (TPR) repeat protein